MEEKIEVDVNLFDLRVTDDPTDSYGRVRSKGKLNNPGIAARIKKEGSEYQLESIVEVLNRADRIKAEGLAAGYSISTPFMHARLGITGVFYGSSYDPNQQKLGARFTPASQTRELINNTKVNVLGQAKTGIVMLSATDSLTGAVNSTITPNNVLVIKGERLQIESDEANADKVGVFFISNADGTSTKATQIISNKNKELIVMVPALAPGDYELQVVTQVSRGSLLKEPREEQLETILTVE
ncbi:DUF4469 domain-containing protein [Carboxylicivirga sediminis]|uniref:DUF4469 domain-containing protein n=1 Tax=Carboxylicivirga sediminis TaxID=2006564 RepID=A0A941F2L4_9BACT|nr:DUF4469 domain-containing protein [Carboxylicivirga sediminis]MBR8534215.1 DUF4469 domain-containing protein [Carboxylicivirga sediminis]